MKRWQKLVLTVVAAVSLAACGNSNGNGSSDGGNGESKRDIRVSLPAQLTTLDTTQTTDKVTFTVAQHLFEGLYRLDETSEPVPGLAESVDISEDGKTYTFHLKDGIKWSNGDPITSADFLYSWTKMVNPDTIGPNAYLLDNVVNSLEVRNGEKSVEDIGLSTPDDQTFVVELVNPQPSFLSVISIAWLAPQHQAFVEEQGDQYGQNSDALLYSGPFTLSDWDSTSETWTLKKNDNYYAADEVKLDQVNGSTVKEESTGIRLFESDEIDLTKISGQYVSQYKDQDFFVSEPEVANVFLDFNKVAVEALGNVHVRKAIALAIDKEGLANSVLNDGSTPLNGLVPARLYANSKTGEDFRAYSGEYNVFDLDEAKSEWAKAKDVVGDGVTLSLIIKDTDTDKRVGEYIQSQLQENLEGLTIDLKPQPAANVNQLRKDKDYELSLSGWIAGSSEINSYFNLYKTGSSYNYGGYDNQEYSDLVDKAITVDANDDDASFADFKAAEKILLEDDASQVPLYQSAASYLINTKVKGIVLHSYGDYYNLRTAYIE